MVLRRGSAIAAWGEPARADLTFSVAKTYLALLAGVAQGQGLLPDENEPVAVRLPGIGFDDSEHNRAVTWAQLLTQTSEWEGTSFGLPDTVDRWRKVAQDPRPAAGPKGGARPLQPPGSYWEYNDVRINQLALALLHLFRRPLPEVFLEQLRRSAAATVCLARLRRRLGRAAGRRPGAIGAGRHAPARAPDQRRDQARIGQSARRRAGAVGS
jgi:CubicO group peptidase (beta-lactamase class C family)